MSAVSNWIAPLLGTAVVIIGWYVAHRLSSRRDLKSKRRDLRIQFLIEAYRRLEHASNRSMPEGPVLDLEKAIADVQLFGTKREVELAKMFAQDFASSGSASLDELLDELRKDLRAELQLEEIPDRITFLRSKS